MKKNNNKIAKWEEKKKKMILNAMRKERGY